MPENKVVPFSDSAFVIDTEFRGLIPPLSSEEREFLEKNLRLDGCRDPLVIWNGLLLDGHNRYEICQRLNIPFKVISADLANRQAAIVWIIENQLGRRNLHPDQASYLRGKRYNGEKKAVGEHAGNQYTEKDQNDPIPTAYRLATEFKVSAPTIKRDGQYAAAVDKLAEVGIEPQSVIAQAPKKTVIETAKAPGNLAEKLALLQKIKAEAKATKKANKEREKTDPYWISYYAWAPVLNNVGDLAAGVEKLKGQSLPPLHEQHRDRLRREFATIITFFHECLEPIL